MRFSTGHFGLFPLLEFAKRHPTIPSGSGNQRQTDYLALRERVTADVPELPGWHLWGHFDESFRWRPVFVGHTKGGRAFLLDIRLREMLSDERIAFWAETYGTEPTVAQVLKIYGRYENESRASARKALARYVIWAGAEDEVSHVEVRRQGRLLIDTYRPSANATKGTAKYGPDELTRSITAALDHEVARIERRP